MSNLEVVAKALVRTTSELAKGAGADASGRNRRSTGRKMRGRAWVAFKNMLFHQGLVFQGMLGDWRGDDPQVLSQWVLLIGSSFSMLVIITFYTAEVTHSLIYRGRTSVRRGARGPASQPACTEPAHAGAGCCLRLRPHAPATDARAMPAAGRHRSPRSPT